MTLCLYKIGENGPTLTIEDVVSYTDNEVRTADGAVYSPLAEGYELSATPDCTGTLRADWREAQRPQDIPLLLRPNVAAQDGQANSYRRGADGLVVVSVAVSAETAGPVADLPEGFRPAAAVSSGDITVHPDGTVWASGGMTGTICYFA